MILLFAMCFNVFYEVKKDEYDYYKPAFLFIVAFSNTTKNLAYFSFVKFACR